MIIWFSSDLLFILFISIIFFTFSTIIRAIRQLFLYFISISSCRQDWSVCQIRKAELFSAFLVRCSTWVPPAPKFARWCSGVTGGEQGGRVPHPRDFWLGNFRWPIGEDFFFSACHFSKPLKFVLSLPKWEFPIGKKHFTPKKKKKKKKEKWLCPLGKIIPLTPLTWWISYRPGNQFVAVVAWQVKQLNLQSIEAYDTYFVMARSNWNLTKGSLNCTLGGRPVNYGLIIRSLMVTRAFIMQIAEIHDTCTWRASTALLHLKSIHPLWKILEKCTPGGVWIFKYTFLMYDFLDF